MMGQFVGGRKVVAGEFRGRKKRKKKKEERKVRKKIIKKIKEEEEEEKMKGIGLALCSGRTWTSSEWNCGTRCRCVPTSVLFYA